MSHNAKYIHIICTDPRIQKIYHGYLVENNCFGHFDSIQYENPILDFLNPDKVGGIMERIKLYHAMHGPDTVALFDHLDCGAYQKNGYVFNDFEHELAVHKENNEKVKEIIKSNLPDFEVTVKYVAIEKTGECRWLKG